MTDLRLIPISGSEEQLIEDRITALRRWYNAFDLAPCNACTFDGDTNDISALDYISYELQNASWYWDDGETHAFAWGNVLVRRFGFHWAKLSDVESPRCFAVRNTEVPYVVFPWPRLYELVENPGNQDSASEFLLLSIISQLDACLFVPDGWHPALDALAGNRPEFPRDVSAMLQELSERDPLWIHRLGMFPYQWNNDTSWDMVRMTIQSCLHRCVSEG